MKILETKDASLFYKNVHRATKKDKIRNENVSGATKSGTTDNTRKNGEEKPEGKTPVRDMVMKTWHLNVKS